MKITLILFLRAVISRPNSPSFGNTGEFHNNLCRRRAAERRLLAFNVTAAYDPGAGGGVPITGDSSNIGLWVALFVISTFTLIILIFLSKRENDEEKSQAQKEKIQ